MSEPIPRITTLAGLSLPRLARLISTTSSLANSGSPSASACDIRKALYDGCLLTLHTALNLGIGCLAGYNNIIVRTGFNKRFFQSGRQHQNRSRIQTQPAPYRMQSEMLSGGGLSDCGSCMTEGYAWNQTGSMIVKRQPPSGSDSEEMVPPCASMIR